jgi:hypothetical protein
MILRRVIAHVRKQEWTAIWIDLVIVVVGVFIGIQVANWNEARASERLGRAYVQRLTVELGQDLVTRRELVEYYAAVLESIEHTNVLLAESESDPKELVINAYRASEFNYRAPSRATWDAIVSSGDTGLLPQDVAAAAADYFAYDSAHNARDILSQSAYRHRVRTIVPLQLQKALRAGCSDVRNENQDITGFKSDCALDIEPAMVATTAAALRADPTVQASLRYQYSDVYSAHANIKGDAAAIDRALAALKGAQPTAGVSP